MSLLDYLTSSLEKPGRAVRGLLSGNAREGLAALPFSDSLGLTDEEDKVSGSDLLKQLGVDPGDGIGGTLAGVGVDVATDPLTYVGGALAKRLLGGGFRTVGKTAADLVPEEFDLGNRYAQMAKGGFPGETGAMPKAVPGPMPGEVTPAGESGPLLQHLLPGADATMPAGELLGQLPHPRVYADALPISRNPRGPVHYDPSEYGVVGDAIQEGSPSNALSALLGGWDQVLGDLGRLHPKALDNPGADLMLHNDWLDMMGHHASDLSATLGLRDALPAHVADQVAGQMQRLSEVSGKLMPHRDLSFRSSPAREAVKELDSGYTMPSEAAGRLKEYAPFIPADERAVRKMAATAQQEQMRQEMMQVVEHLGEGDQGFIPPELWRDAPHGDGMYNDSYLYGQLRQLFNPQSSSYKSIEPGIRMRALTDPPDTYLKEMLRMLPDVEQGAVRELIESYDPRLLGVREVEDVVRRLLNEPRTQTGSAFEGMVHRHLRPFSESEFLRRIATQPQPG